MKQIKTKDPRKTGAPPFHHHLYQLNSEAKSQDTSTKAGNEQTPDQTSKSIKSKDVPTKMLVDDIAIRQLAYEIFQEKGGSDLDNWFEQKTLSHSF